MKKLIRDRIPQIALAKDGVPMKTYIADLSEYSSELSLKLLEETWELRAAPEDIGEFADVLEVLYAMGKLVGFSPEDIESARLAKREKRGGFEKRIIWEGE